MQYEFVAVDFDGTLCEDAFPEIGRPRHRVIAYVKRLAAEGSKIILHTAREDGTRKLLTEAVRFCEDHGIPLFAVNENPGNPYVKTYGSPSRKVYADLYIDDRAIHPDDIPPGNAIIGGKHRKGGSAMDNKTGTRRTTRTRRKKRSKGWTVAKYGLLTVCGIFLFKTAHASATVTRGYIAYGGEVFLLALPVLYYLITTMAKDWRDTVKAVFGEAQRNED